jgi:presenilin-like A22 family membrane protease
MITGKRQTGSQLLTTVKETIKWILGILATVAVVICLYAGFIMMTSAGDENKYKNGMKILKYAAIGLVIIALSWLIVSAIFWFVNLQ